MRANRRAGTHTELMQSKGVYQEIAASQLSDEELAQLAANVAACRQRQKVCYAIRPTAERSSTMSNRARF